MCNAKLLNPAGMLPGGNNPLINPVAAVANSTNRLVNPASALYNKAPAQPTSVGSLLTAPLSGGLDTRKSSLLGS